MDIKNAAYDLLLKNRRTKDGYQYTVPSPKSYPYQWLWDSCFHAIVLTHFSPEDAKKELLSLASHQFQNGLLPHMIYWEKFEGVADVQWGTKDTSSITQPPMIAYATWQVYKKDHDSFFLEKMYPTLYHYYQYLLTERDPRRNHLIGIINPDESGEDNSPRFDNALGMPLTQTLDENYKRRLEFIEKNKTCNFDAPFCMKKFFWIKDVPFNAITVANLRILAEIAKTIGQYDDATYFLEQAILIEKSMRDRMYEEGLFWSTQGPDYTKIKIKTWAIFAPLFARMLSHDEAKKLVDDYLLNPNEFMTPFMVPTVAKSEKDYYDPNGFWRGPVWIAINWFLYKGLMYYGFEDIAQKIKAESIALVEKNGFREHFNPETGEAQGAEEFTWAALVIDMV